jgi:hypothetical protein
MVIYQRNAGASVTPTATTYTLDRWQATLSQSSKYSVQQSSVAPTGFVNSTLITSLSAYSVGASDFFDYRQSIEGFNVSDLGWGTANAKTVTLSFWVRSSLTGTFGGALTNNNQDRTYPFTYTISSANTWEQKTVTIAGPTSGTWLTTNGVGVRLWFDLGTGTGYNGTANTWTASQIYRTAGSVQLLANSGATFYITGVQLEVGSSATGFEYVNYQTLLANCQRYYWQMVNGDQNNIANGVYYSGDTFICSVQYPVTMRTAPSLSYVTGTSYYIIYVNGSDPINAMYLGATTATGTNLESGGQGASGPTGYGGQLRSNNASAKLAFTAEL